MDRRHFVAGEQHAADERQTLRRIGVRCTDRGSDQGDDCEFETHTDPPDAGTDTHDRSVSVRIG